MVSKDVTPVRIGDRWIDGGAPKELWLEDGSTGLMLEVVPRTSRRVPALAMLVQRVDDEESTAEAIVVHDPVAQELRVESSRGDVLAPPVDLAWLRSRLDPELLAGLAHRAERMVRAGDPHDWKDGDVPRAAVGSRVVFADVFPCAWDIVTMYQDRRYVLIDRYELDRRAGERPIELEVVDLTDGTSLGIVEVEQGRRSKAKKGPAPPLAQRIVQQVRDDVDEWYELEHRAAEIARVARRLATWSDDLRDPAVPVRELLRASHDGSPDLVDRVEALGVRAAPALRDALADPSHGRDALRMAARRLAWIGDPAGIPHLVDALRDLELEDYEVSPFVDAMGGLRKQAIEPLLAALESEGELEARGRLLEGLVAIGVKDDRIVSALLDGVRRDTSIAVLLADYGHDGTAVVGTLSALLAERLDGLGDAGSDDLHRQARCDAVELAQVLRELGALDAELEGRLNAAVAVHRGARRAGLAGPAVGGGDPEFDDLEELDIDEVPVQMPIRVVPRPGRNEPCWCGNGKKYKKCHLDADEAGPPGAQ